MKRSLLLLLGVWLTMPLSGVEKIVCFGDSLTSCGGKGGRYSDMLQKDLPEYKFINSGKGGTILPELLKILK